MYRYLDTTQRLQNFYQMASDLTHYTTSLALQTTIPKYLTPLYISNDLASLFALLSKYEIPAIICHTMIKTQNMYLLTYIMRSGQNTQIILSFKHS